MEHTLVIPKFPLPLSMVLLVLVTIEAIIYGSSLGVMAVWAPLLFGVFYIGYTALFRHDALPLIFSLLFLTAHHSLLYHFENDFPIESLFWIIFAVNSTIMWLLLRYATHLKHEHHMAYSLISGFLIAQILTVFASTARDWPFRLELAAYMPTLFSYLFWRFACLSAEAMLNTKQFMRLAIVVVVLVAVVIIGSPNVGV